MEVLEGLQVLAARHYRPILGLTFRAAGKWFVSPGKTYTGRTTQLSVTHTKATEVTLFIFLNARKLRVMRKEIK